MYEKIDSNEDPSLETRLKSFEGFSKHHRNAVYYVHDFYELISIVVVKQSDNFVVWNGMEGICKN